MTILDEVNEKIVRFTKEIYPGAVVDNKGRVTFDYESTKVWVDVVTMSHKDASEGKAFADKHQLPSTLIRVQAILVSKVPRSPALFQWVAVDSRRKLGSVNVILDDEGTCDLFFMYTLAGDTLDASEMKHALFIVAAFANQLDDEIQAKFGGKRWAELKKG
jgi:hypothetical protein